MQKVLTGFESLFCMSLFLSVCVYGGSDRRAQIDTVRSGVQIVIGMHTVYSTTV